jgi:hypothetical protein
MPISAWLPCQELGFDRAEQGSVDVCTGAAFFCNCKITYGQRLLSAMTIRDPPTASAIDPASVTGARGVDESELKQRERK